jgi:two-component system OmpR family sensor kinase
MNLRTRLVIALVVLATAGLAIFGVTTYSLYKRSQEHQLDAQLRDTSGGQAGRLARDSFFGIDSETCEVDGVTGSGRGTGTGEREGTVTSPTVTTPGGNVITLRGAPGPGQSLEGYSELRSANGNIIACAKPVSVSGRPELPKDLGTVDKPRYLTVGSTEGSGEWRVLIAPAQFNNNGPSGPGGNVTQDFAGSVIIVAVRTSGIDSSMSHLLSIELIAALCLLTALASGAWVILRHGLRPLEEMATSAATINAGDLSQRVEPADGRTEVGQLGLALNTMLDGIEVSFQEREATERKLRQFLSDASHELRTPLTSIQGFAELFRLGADNERPDLPVILRRIEQESARMKTLVEDLLLLARLDETRPVETMPVDLSVLAADACTDAVALAPDRQVTLDAPEPVVVRGDSDHLRQAIANLVTNAVKHTPQGAAVEVGAKVSGDRAIVTVRDHGGGLDEAALAHVFDRFWQADSARVGAGSGLGLSIVAGIAEEHGGRAAASNAPDGGAVFTIDIPLAGPTGPATVDS